MSWLGQLPIRWKLIAIIVVSSTIALMVANAALFAWDSFAYRQDLREDLESVAEILGRNSTAAIQFGDPDTGRDLLSALTVKPDVRWAAIYDGNEALFAAYQSPAGVPPPPRAPPEGDRFTTAGLEVARPILLDNARIGTIALMAGLDGLYSRLWRRATTVGLLLLAAGMTALLVAHRLQRPISNPILSLTRLAREVSADQNYSLRAQVVTRDEIGVLGASFNDMLSQIERRDADLLAAKITLERRVQERTAELNQELQERHRTERELAERNAELEQTNRELDDFAYIASHDLKEPLRGIHNYSQFLLEDHADRLDDEGRAMLSTLVRLSRRMEVLIDSLLHYSRIGRGDLTFTRVDVRGLVTEVLDTLALMLKEARVDVRIAERMPVVRADRDRLGEVFANLITNAVKYNDKPERRIEIGMVEPGPSADEVTLYVRDNGIGIQERHLETVFRIFKRLHARDEFGGGTGAGLTIVRKIIDRHQGRVWIDSSPGEGTTVFFTLGRERADQPVRGASRS